MLFSSHQISWWFGQFQPNNIHFNLVCNLHLFRCSVIFASAIHFWLCNENAGPTNELYDYYDIEMCVTFFKVCLFLHTTEHWTQTRVPEQQQQRRGGCLWFTSRGNKHILFVFHFLSFSFRFVSFVLLCFELWVYSALMIEYCYNNYRNSKNDFLFTAKHLW